MKTNNQISSSTEQGVVEGNHDTKLKLIVDTESNGDSEQFSFSPLSPPPISLDDFSTTNSSTFSKGKEYFSPVPFASSQKLKKTLKNKRSAAEITRSAIQKLKERSTANATNASYYVLDAWTGHLENGLAENLKKSKTTFTIYKIQTSQIWKCVNILAIFCHSASVMLQNPCLLQLVTMVCIFLYVFDICMKLIYMGPKTYFSKKWQLIYMTMVGVLILEFMMSFRWKMYFLKSCRPLLLVLRERTIRRFFSVFKDMFPGFLKVCLSSAFFLAFASIFTTAYFQNFLSTKSFVHGLFEHWVLISTGDTYRDLLPTEMKGCVAYMVAFFSILVLGSFFLRSMLMGVMYEVFLEHTREQVKKERLKEYKGLVKAFSILDPMQYGTVDKRTFMKLVACLRPNLSEKQQLLYFELAAHGEAHLKLIDFLDLKYVLSYKFIFKQKQEKQYGMNFWESSTLWRLCFHFLSLLDQSLFSACWFNNFIKMAYYLDFFLLFFEKDPNTQRLVFWSFILLSADCGFKLAIHACVAKKSFDFHEIFSILGILFQSIFGIFGHIFCSNEAQSLMLGNMLQTARLIRCWRIVQFNRNLQQYFGCLFQTLPVLFQTLSFAMIIAYFFAMVGMVLFSKETHYFETPNKAILTMVQLFFSIDFWTVISECSRHSPPVLGHAFFVVYFLVGVDLVFYLIQSIIIHIYGESMNSTSQIQMDEERKKDKKLETQLFERVTQKHVLSMLAASPSSPLLPKLRMTKNDFGWLHGANMRRKITGTSSQKLSKDEITKIQQFANKIEYEVDLKKMYDDKIKGRSRLHEFEEELYYNLRSDKNTEEECYTDGETIIHMGDMNRKCYLIHKGSVDIRYLSGFVRTLRKGQMFGEEILLGGLPQGFECIAKGDVTLLVVQIQTLLKDFDQQMQSHLASKAIRSVIKTEATNNKLCSKSLVKKLPPNIVIPVSILEENSLKSNCARDTIVLRVSASFESSKSDDSKEVAPIGDGSSLHHSLHNKPYSYVKHTIKCSSIDNMEMLKPDDDSFKAPSIRRSTSSRRKMSDDLQAETMSLPAPIDHVLSSPQVMKNLEIVQIEFDPFYWCFDDFMSHGRWSCLNKDLRLAEEKNERLFIENQPCTCM